MSEFTASNGVRIVLTNSGAMFHSPGDSWPNPLPHTVFANADVAAALREFYQAERDEELGRWRYPDDRDYVVYPVGSGEVVHVLNEKAGVSGQYERAEVNKVFGGEFLETADPVYSRAARDYFDAHPVRKPWEDAKDGEVWMLTGAAHPDEEVPYIAIEGRFFQLPPRKPSDPMWIPAAFAGDFSHGERFWPESD